MGHWDGTVPQSQQQHMPGDYAHERMAFPVIGIVMEVYLSDRRTNRSSVLYSDQRGSQHECRVLVVNDGKDTPWPIPNVAILPRGASGVDDFQEELPRPSSMMIDGGVFKADGTVDPSKLDGDWVVVGFIGGRITQPFVIGWWPHPGNRVDPATSSEAGNGVLAQGRRSFKRYRGTKLTVTNTGNLYVDTNESNFKIEGSQQGTEKIPLVLRKKVEEGGDIQVDVKKERQLEMNWNPPAPDFEAQPSLPQLVDDSGKPIGNPPKQQNDREDTVTRFTLNQKDVELIAGEVFKILTRDQQIEIFAKTKVGIHGDDGNDSVILGDTDPSNCDHAVKGETFKDDKYNKLVAAFNAHMHTSSVGPTGSPIPDPSPSAPIPAQNMGSSELSQPVMVKK